MATPTFETLAYDVKDGIATITLNRPDKLNAFNTQMMKDMIAAFDVTDADDAVKVVIVTGAGRGFCAGADLSGGAQTFDYDARGGEDKAARTRDGVQRDGGGLLTLRIYESLKPVIAAVNGPAVGVGVTMQLPMDIRLASTEARFGLVFARRGLNPEAASSWFLPKVVGVQTALEWCYTGRIFSAQEALDKGLVRSLHAPEDLRPSPSPSPVSCCGAWPAPTTPWRPTAPTAGASRPAAPWLTPVKASCPSWRSARQPSPTRCPMTCQTFGRPGARPRSSEVNTSG